MTLSRPYISRKSTVIRWILPTRHPQADHFGLLSNVVFGLYLEGTPAIPLPSKYVFTLLSSSPSYSMPPRHGLSFQQMSSLSLKAFHMECQRIILRILWRQFVRNSEISALTGLPAINYTSSDIVASPSLVTSPHSCGVVYLCINTPAHKALDLQSHVNISLGCLPHPSWSRRLGRPRGRWIDLTLTLTTPARHLPTSGDRPLDAVIMDERRDGPRWLCDDDDC